MNVYDASLNETLECILSPDIVQIDLQCVVHHANNIRLADFVAQIPS